MVSIIWNSKGVNWKLTLGTFSCFCIFLMVAAVLSIKKSWLGHPHMSFDWNMSATRINFPFIDTYHTIVAFTISLQYQAFEPRYFSPISRSLSLSASIVSTFVIYFWSKLSFCILRIETSDWFALVVTQRITYGPATNILQT